MGKGGKETKKGAGAEDYRARAGRVNARQEEMDDHVGALHV